MAERALTDLQIERALAEARDLPAKATEADRARAAELRAANDAYLASVDVDVEVRRIQARVRIEQSQGTPSPGRGKRWFMWIAPFGALAAAAAVVLVLIRRPANDDDVITKGGIALVLHRPSGTLHDGDTVTPGERIRFEVSGTQAGYVAITGVDGSGKHSIYVPVRSIGRDRLLPGAIELDATPGDEHFIATFATHPFDLSAVPADAQTAEIVLHKK